MSLQTSLFHQGYHFCNTVFLVDEKILEEASIRCAHAHAPAAKPLTSLTELTHSGLFRPSKDLYYVSLLEGELGTTFSKSTLTEEPDSLRELQNSELGSWDTGENSGKLQVSVGNSRYEKSRGQLTCGIGKDPAILPKRCGLWVGRHLSERMCGASLTVGLCTHVHTPRHVPTESHICKLTYKQMPARHICRSTHTSCGNLS